MATESSGSVPWHEHLMDREPYTCLCCGAMTTSDLLADPATTVMTVEMTAELVAIRASLARLETALAQYEPLLVEYSRRLAKPRFMAKRTV